MKTFILCIALCFSFLKYSAGQILCILCYDQNDSISTGVTNLILDGGFENSNCQPGYIGDVYCPNSQYYSCDLPNWTCTGGGFDTYACLFNYATGHSIIVEGTKACYMGNWYCQACSAITDDTSCLDNVECTSSGIPVGYPVNLPDYGGNTGLTLSQTVNGLTPGNTYVLEFWAGGEQDYGLWPAPGVFALDVGFGDTLLRNPSTPNIGGVGKRYIVEFNATSSSQTIKFTNWGHICSGCTELVLDDVRLYPLDQLDPSIPVCLNFNPSFAASDTDVCQKFCINFFDSSQNNPTSWLWEFAGGSPPTSTDQNPTNICYNAPGQYDVTLITTNASGNDTLTLHNYITVYQTPAFPTITQNGYTLTSSTATSYQWQLNSEDIPGATDQSYEVMETGFYTVIVSDENGCANSTTLYVEITGIGPVISNFNFSVYPNPSTGNFTIELQHAQDMGEVSIVVENAIGQKVYSSEENISSDDWKKEIDLSELSHGVYYIELKSNDFFGKKKTVISKK